MTLYQKMTEEQVDEMWKLSQEYMDFIRKNNSDRERIAEYVKILEEEGFKEIELGNIEALHPGNKFYIQNYEKNLIAGIVGSDTLTNGVTLLGAHCDYPHLDLKPVFVKQMEDQNAVVLKTHYYGGIKKYLYTTVPLVMKVFECVDGVTKVFTIGEKEDDPVFNIPDLLLHLSADEAEKKVREVITGEEMNIIGCSGAKEESVTLTQNFYDLLEKRTSIKKEDVKYCEFSFYPAVPHRYVGLDKMIIGGPGQDDGICCFCEMEALLRVNNPKATALACMYSFEETGSYGCTGAMSAFTEEAMENVFYRIGLQPYQFPVVYEKSVIISADVTALYDVNFPEAHEKLNAAVLNYGVVVSRYTGGRGKSGSSEAETELLDIVRRRVGQDNLYEFAELGRVDLGGGGTIARFLSEELNIRAVDIGTGLMNMHSWFELAGVVDLWSTFEVFRKLMQEHE